MQYSFSVEQGYNISLTFFIDLWPFIEPTVKQRSLPFLIYELFFLEVCSGYESSAEWNEAIFRAKNIPKNNQRNLKITETDLFLCAIEFCKIHNERWDFKLNFVIELLESMKNNPKNHVSEWSFWRNAVDDVIHKSKQLCDFNWSAELP